MPPKVVIVDDDANIRELFENAFSASCQVFSAAEGQAALELIRGDKIDLVFLDITMPGLSGLDVLRIIKQSGPEPVVWMLTGNEELEVITEAIGLGAAGYLTKPVNITKIREIFNSVLKPDSGKSRGRPWVVKRQKGTERPGRSKQ